MPASARTRPTGVPRRVAVLVDTSTSWGRRLIQGIHEFALSRGWQLFLEPLGMEERISLSGKWKGDGVIARVGYREMAADLRKLRVPVVNVSGIVIPRVSFPRVTVDLHKAALLAAEYLVARGFRHFAYFGSTNLDYVAVHQRAFEQVLRKHGYECAHFATITRTGAASDWSVDRDSLSRWLKTLPRPLAVLTWNAGGARDVLYACQAAGFYVPDEVSILAGSDDELFCALSPVPLSAVRGPAEKVGAEAAQILDSLMAGRTVASRIIRLAPTEIVTRRSTESFAVSDPALVKALHFIRSHATEPIQVQDVARAAAVSRRILERRFSEYLQRTPADEIRRIRMEKAAQLLAETNLSIPEVAASAGFMSAEYLSYAFKRETGKSPLEYRRESGRKNR